MSDWWMVGLTAVSVVVAVIALVIAWRSNRTAGDANSLAHESIDVSRDSNTIARHSQSAASEANRIARESVEAAGRSADAAEASEQRQGVAEERALEVHDVQWNASWDVSPPLDIHPHTADRRMWVSQYGPDDAFKVQILFYVGAFCWFTHEVDEVKRDGHLTLIPVDRKKLIAKQNKLGFYDKNHQRIQVDPYSDRALDHLISHTQRAYHFPIRLIFRWESGAGVRHQETLLLPPLVQITNGKPDFNPPRDDAAAE